jgi:hypothetical protein
MNRRELKALCRQTFRQLGLTPPLDVDLLRDRLAERRGKPIDLVPTRNLTGHRTFGFTASSAAAPCDVIMYEAGTSRTHQCMIILHELAHMICDHPMHAVDHSYRAPHVSEFREISPEILAGVLGTRPPNGRGRGGAHIGQSLYDNPVEWEAETMATIMIAWVAGGGGPTRRPADPFEAILSTPPAW